MPYVYPGPTAITSGLIVFMWIVHFAPSMGFVLRPADILDGAYGQFFSNLSMYPLDHVDLPHLIVNSFAMFVLLPELELKKGTIRVGVLLNLFAVLTGLLYTVLILLGTLIISENVRDSTFEGSSAWLFTVYTWNCYRLAAKPENLNNTWEFPNSIKIQKLKLYPVISFIVLSVIFFKSTSFFGHLSGILVGLVYSHFQHVFDVTLCLPRELLLKIETFKFWTGRNYSGFNLTKFLNLLQIKYVMEDLDPLNQSEEDQQQSLPMHYSADGHQFAPLATEPQQAQSQSQSQLASSSSQRKGRRNTVSDKPVSMPDFAAPPSLNKKLSSASPVRTRSRKGTLLDSQKPASTKIL